MLQLVGFAMAVWYVQATYPGASLAVRSYSLVAICSTDLSVNLSLRRPLTLQILLYLVSIQNRILMLDSDILKLSFQQGLAQIRRPSVLVVSRHTLRRKLFPLWFCRAQRVLNAKW